MELVRSQPDGRLQHLLEFEHEICRRFGEAICSRPLIAMMRASSRFGDWGLSVVVGLLLMASIGPRAIGVWAGITAVALVVQKVLKKTCARSRPCEKPNGPLQRAPIPDKGSFPSGHTLHAAMAAVVITALIPMLTTLTIAVAALIGMSRVVLGVHYPSDVVAGATLGAFFGSIGILLI